MDLNLNLELIHLFGPTDCEHLTHRTVLRELNARTLPIVNKMLGLVGVSIDQEDHGSSEHVSNSGFDPKID